MDIEKLIEQLKWWAKECDRTNKGCQARRILQDAATALATLQPENQALRNAANGFKAEDDKLRAELEKVKAERDAAKSETVLEAVDELMEFARTRMCTADWLYYVEVLGEWRGQKED